MESAYSTCSTKYVSTLHVLACKHTFTATYSIAGNIGEVFNLANWQFYRKLPNLKSTIFHSDII